MALWICTACGLEHEDSAAPPERCEVCTDERQFVPLTGQAWITAKQLESQGTLLHTAPIETGLHRLSVAPRVGIGQQALLVQTSTGNLLWEPPGFISDAAAQTVRALGGVAAISGSHPHLMGAMVSWSQAFGGAPIYIAAADRAWTRRPDSAIVHWSGEANPLPGIRLVQCGGHFAGSSVLHWADGADGRGVIFTGDTIFIGPSGRTVSAMRSYPNLLPLPEGAVGQILDRLEPLVYDRAYGSFGQVIPSDAREVVRRSLARYIEWLRGEVDDY
ncbi:MBL fold metallo-hydrolase [Leifsonia kafniensis]|uniref:MBL fold metallo-hydrolase n=1 Tax=Leifsonia kafniensis TaxID=475957 RepID=A0ABP7L6K8_9MICO